MKYLCKKYSEKDFSAIGQFSYDILEGEKLTNKEIAHQLNKLGYIDEFGMPKFANLKFLEKVSPSLIFPNLFIFT